MTLPTFLLAAADSKFVWLGGKRLAVPAVNERWSPPRVLGIVAVHTTLAILVALVISLAIAGQPWAWLVWLLGLFAVCQSFVVAGLMALCWNQRVARLKQHPDSPTGLQPSRFRFGRWALGMVYFVLLGIVTPLAMVVTAENARGQFAWRREQAQLAARGERLTIREILGPEIPASENAGAAKVFAPFFDYPHDGGYHPRPEVTNAIARLKEVLAIPFGQLPEKTNTPSRTPKHPDNLADWSTTYRKLAALHATDRPGWTSTRKLPPPGDPARDVLSALAFGDATLAEICEASARPRAQLPLHWDEGFFPQMEHQAFLKTVQQHLKLRATAHLAAGETDAAFAVATNALNVAELLREEPLLISQLVRMAQFALVISPLWEGCMEHRWSDAQLAGFQERLARVDFLSGLVRAFEGERVCGIAGVNQIISNPPGMGAGESAASLRRLAILLPFGLLRQNQVALANYQTEYLNELRTLQTNAVPTAWATKISSRESSEKTKFAQMPYSPFTFFVKHLVPATVRAENRAARAQTMAHLAITACALERHRLAHNSYPETLDALVPAFLPKPLLDPMNAKPFQYRRTEDDWFLLYSVGEDGRDDGGVFRAKAKGPILDWPWPVPGRPDEGSLF